MRARRPGRGVLAGAAGAAAALALASPAWAQVLPPEPPGLAWAALALAAAATALGAAALTAALVARGRRGAAAPTGPDPRIAERLQRLEIAVHALAPRQAVAASAPPREPFPPAGATPAGVAPARPPPSPAPAASVEAWLAEVADEFARLARDPSAAAAPFIAGRRPRGAAAGAESVALVDGLEGAKLWAVRAPAALDAGGEAWALVPGEAAAVNWSAHFAPHRREVAEEAFGGAFDLIADGEAVLRLGAPALARADPATGRLVVQRRGRLAGFRA